MTRDPWPEGAQSSDPAGGRARRRIWINLTLLFAYSCVIYAIGFFAFPGLVGDRAGVYVTLAIPFSIGFLSQLLFDPHREKGVGAVLLPLLFVILVLSFVLLLLQVETLICIVMAVPFFAILSPAGVLAARYLQTVLHRRFGGTTLYSLTAAFPFLPLLMTPLVPLPAEIVSVREEIVIAAPAPVVWQQTVEIAEIAPQERIWTLSHGLLRAPMALDARVEGQMRHLRWTKGVRFREQIREYIPNRRLAWRFVFHDKDSLHGFDLHVDPDSETLKLLDGWYELTPEQGGRTRLVLESRYRLSTPVNWALKPWGQLFLGDFQRSVLHVIRLRAEADAG